MSWLMKTIAVVFIVWFVAFELLPKGFAKIEQRTEDSKTDFSLKMVARMEAGQ